MNRKKQVVFVSGANRGIGFELAKQLAAKGYDVAGGYRNEDASKELISLARQNDNILPVKVDVSHRIEIERAKELIQNRFGLLDVIINNAGINLKTDKSVNEIEWEHIEQNLKVNVGGPLLISSVFYPLLLRGDGKKLVHISSMMGSIALCKGGAIPYRISKAALNMLAKNQALEYKKDDVKVVCIHPGWVQTDMGGRAAPLTTVGSVRHLVTTIEQIEMSQTGTLLNYDGTRLPY